MREKWFLGNLKRPNLWVRGIFVILLICAFTTPALAHRVVIFAYTEGDIVHTESKFMPNTPVNQGKILVQDAQTGKELLTGQTDAKGKFSFNRPAEAAGKDLKIVIDAGVGHRAEFLLKAQ
jgi:nickel transport protein